MIKRIIAMFLLSSILSVSAFAESHQSMTSDILLTIQPESQPEQIEVSVPLQIPILLRTDGTAVISQDLGIQNRSANLDVQLESLSVSSANGWQVVDFNKNIPAGTKQFALSFKGDPTIDGGEVKLAQSNWLIPHGTTSKLNTLAKISKQSVETQQTVGIGKLNYVFST